MSEPATAQGGLIARRLNELWATRPTRDDGRPSSLRDVASAINEQAGRSLLSAQNLSALLTGTRTEPSFAILEAVARYFGVTPAFFIADDETASQTLTELNQLRALRESGVLHLALCAAELSPRNLATITELVEQLRRAEGLSQEPLIHGGGQDTSA